MVPLVVLVGATLVARTVGALGWPALDDWGAAIRAGLAAMLALTASAHFGSRRADLIRMVPPTLPRPDVLVTATGLAELAVALGLLVPATAQAAAAVLIVLLAVMFPANVHAARAGVGIGGRPPTPLLPRALMQVSFAAAAAGALVG